MSKRRRGSNVCSSALRGAPDCEAVCGSNSGRVPGVRSDTAPITCHGMPGLAACKRGRRLNGRPSWTAFRPAWTVLTHSSSVGERGLGHGVVFGREAIIGAQPGGEDRTRGSFRLEMQIDIGEPLLFGETIPRYSAMPRRPRPVPPAASFVCLRKVLLYSKAHSSKRQPILSIVSSGFTPPPGFGFPPSARKPNSRLTRIGVPSGNPSAARAGT